MSDRNADHLVIRLFGPLRFAVSDGRRLRLPGGRQQALLALLASAPDMWRHRSWLIDKLWSDSAPDRGRANLRQLLHATRQSLGAEFADLFDVASDCIGLRPQRVRLAGGPEDGELLEGFDLSQEGFEDWLRDQRMADVGTVARAMLVASAPAARIKPRVVVFPFGEVAETGRQGLGDALAHEITAGFARSQLIDAISHFSARTVAAAQVPPAGAAETSDADYAITGQCRLGGDRLTVSVTLFDLSDGKALWSDSHRTGFAAFLAGEDDLAAHVVGQSLRLVMSSAVATSRTRPLPELAAHRLMISGVSLMHAFEQRHFRRAEEQLREVARRCARHSEPLAWLAQWHLLRVFQKWSPDPTEDMRRAGKLVAAAEDINPDCALTLAIDANIHTVLRGDFDTAEARFAAAQAINPSSAMISHLASVLATFRGDGAEAVRLTERGFALSPRDPRAPFFQTLSAGSYVAGGQYAKAVEMAEASLRRNPHHLSAHRCRVLGLQLGGRGAEARRAASDLLRVDPDLTVTGYLRTHPAGQGDLGRKLGLALEEAGIPAH